MQRGIVTVLVMMALLTRAPDARAQAKPKPPAKPPAKKPMLIDPPVFVLPSEKPAAKESPPGLHDCPACRGLKLVPLKAPKPYVWVEGMPAPKPQDAVRAAHCPKCQADADPASLVELETLRLKTANETHKKWEKAAFWQMTRVETRHATLHTLVNAQESQRLGLAVEALATHLQKVTGSMELTPTTPDTYDLFVLWEQRNYDHFRTTLEKAAGGPEKLGPMWVEAKRWAGYDDFHTPHFFETPETVRTRPVAHGTLYFFARRQIQTATNWHAPPWLSEGFASYGEHAVLRTNRWYAIYDANRGVSTGPWLQQLRGLAIGKRLRPFSDMLKREFRDWESNDYIQSFGMVTFLLESEPQKFLDFTRELQDQNLTSNDALERAYGVSVPELEKKWEKWLAGGK